MLTQPEPAFGLIGLIFVRAILVFAFPISLYETVMACYYWLRSLRAPAPA